MAFNRLLSVLLRHQWGDRLIEPKPNTSAAATQVTKARMRLIHKFILKFSNLTDF